MSALTDLLSGAGLNSDQISVIYDSSRPTWWMQDSRGDYVIVTESGVRRALRANGLSPDVATGATLSALDKELLRLTRFGNVAFAGPVAGWAVGVHEMAGRRVLVPSGCTILRAESVPCDTLQALFRRMLGEDQYYRFLLWLHFARQRLIRQRWHPLPAVGFIGPPSAGKSFAQSIITRQLGGRVGKPAQFMQGVTSFNADLFGAEHLAFEDESSRTDNINARTMDLISCRQAIHPHRRHPGIGST